MKFCQYCGKQLDDAAKFCDQCGKAVEPVRPAAPLPVPVQQKAAPTVPASPSTGREGFATASFIIAIVGSALFFLLSDSLFSLPLIAGIVFGILGIKSKKKVFSIIGLVFCSVLLLFAVISNAMYTDYSGIGDIFDSVLYV